MATNKQDRLRADIWSTLRPHIESEMERTGLSAQEVINMAIAGYFGLSPKGVSTASNTSPNTSVKTSQESSKTSVDDDYI